MKQYRGSRGDHGVSVMVLSPGSVYPLPFRLDLQRHSPTGFEWGYLGSGPAQLALAILADTVGAGDAQTYHQQFKEAVIAQIRDTSWTLTEEFVRGWVSNKKNTHEL